MISARGARALARLMALVVLAASGSYLLIYLYRWEWNRAIISGVFFLGAEIALATSMVLVRLRRLEERLQEGFEPRPQVAEAGADGEKPFAWLDPTGGGFAVFVPVLMGAGFVLSALAFVIEKVAGALTPTDAPDRASPPVRPRPVPAQSLVPAPGSLPVVSSPAPARSRRNPLATVVAVTVLGLLLLATVDVLADATQDRPDPIRGGSTTMELAVSIRSPGPTVREAGEALWAACSGLLPGPIRRVGLTPVGPHRLRLALDGVVGRNARRRFVGCLEDATLDRAQARVVEVTTRPGAGGPVA